MVRVAGVQPRCAAEVGVIKCTLEVWWSLKPLWACARPASTPYASLASTFVDSVASICAATANFNAKDVSPSSVEMVASAIAKVQIVSDQNF